MNATPEILKGPAGLTAGETTLLACLLEASAPKPGNVHRSADFANTTFYDFQVSAVAISTAMQNAVHLPLGETIYNSVSATLNLVKSNTNLGIVLLLAPLATAAQNQDLRVGLADVLRNLNSDDAQRVYESIALANPGGLGKVEEQDIADQPPSCLIEAMRLAEKRDRIAWQYTHDFEDVFDFVTPKLVENFEKLPSLADSIIHTHLQTMATFPDSLIARKLGQEAADKSAIAAQRVLDSGSPDSTNYLNALTDLDFWLRQLGNQRNPGTTADLIAAALYVGFWQGSILPI